MTIRLMEAADYEAVYALWTSTPGMGLNDVDDSKAGIAKFLSRNPHTCFIAEEPNGIAGVILAGHDGRRGYIYHTAVAVEQRKQGIGSALVERVCQAMKDEGITKVALVVFTKNTSGSAFWEKCGFTKRDDLQYRNKALQALVRMDTE